MNDDVDCVWNVEKKWRNWVVVPGTVEWHRLVFVVQMRARVLSWDKSCFCHRENFLPPFYDRCTTHGGFFVRCEGKFPTIIKDVLAGCCLRPLEKLIIDSELCSNEARAFCSIFQFNLVLIYFRMILGGIQDWLAGCPDGCEICSGWRVGRTEQIGNGN